MHKFYNKNILITGGAGFIGSKLAESLIEQNANVTIIDNLKTGLFELVPKKCTFYLDSVENFNIVNQLCENQDYVFHFATNVLLDTEIFSDLSTNLKGTLNILNSINSKTRLIFASTTSIYGNNRKYDKIPEIAPPDLLSSYSITKFAAENYIKLKCKNYNIVRYSNVYGPNQSPKNPKCGVVSKFLSQNPIEITGQGTDVRDFTYIDDAIDLTMRLAVTPRANTIYNCSTGIGTKLLDLATACARLTKSPIVSVPKRTIDNIEKRVVDNFKAIQTLEWSPKIKLEEGLIRTYEFIKNCSSNTLRP